MRSKFPRSAQPRVGLLLLPTSSRRVFFFSCHASTTHFHCAVSSDAPPHYVSWCSRLLWEREDHIAETDHMVSASRSAVLARWQRICPDVASDQPRELAGDGCGCEVSTRVVGLGAGSVWPRQYSTVHIYSCLSVHDGQCTPPA